MVQLRNSDMNSDHHIRSRSITMSITWMLVLLFVVVVANIATAKCHLVLFFNTGSVCLASPFLASPQAWLMASVSILKRSIAALSRSACEVHRGVITARITAVNATGVASIVRYLYHMVICYQCKQGYGVGDQPWRR